jgi:hypothetical protein
LFTSDAEFLHSVFEGREAITPVLCDHPGGELELDHETNDLLFIKAQGLQFQWAAMDQGVEVPRLLEDGFGTSPIWLPEDRRQNLIIRELLAATEDRGNEKAVPIVLWFAAVFGALPHGISLPGVGTGRPAKQLPGRTAV